MGERMNEDINRIRKGYKPKADKRRYWILYDVLSLMAMIKLRIFNR